MSATIIERYLIEVELDEEITAVEAMSNFYLTTSRYNGQVMPIQEASVDGNKVYIKVYHMDNEKPYHIYYGSDNENYLSVAYSGIKEPLVVLFNKIPEHNSIVEPTVNMSADVVPQDCSVLPTEIIVCSNGVDITNRCTITAQNNYKWCSIAFRELEYDAIYNITIDILGIVEEED